MQISGTFEVAAPSSLVVQSLQDLDILRAAIPGCTGIEVGAPPGTFNLTAEVGIGPIRGEQRAIITFGEADVSPLTFALTGAGTSRVEATATVSITENGAKTRVQYEASLSAHGAVARLGGKQIEGAARLLVGQMLRSMKTEIEARVG